MAQKASLRLISPGTIVLGKAFPYSIYDKSGVLLFCQGSVIHMADQATRLVGRGAQYNEDESPAALPGQDEQSAFENLNGLILNLKHALLTAIKTPEQIDVSARFMKIAQSVQLICKEDIDSALAAPSLDAFNPYIVVHQMMGAVLTELIAQNRGFSSEQRLSLVCAALVRILISKIGLLPPGTVVKLKCGEIAVIKSPTVKAVGATVFSIYGKSGMILAVPVRRHTSHN